MKEKFKKENYIGKTFGKLTILSFGEPKTILGKKGLPIVKNRTVNCSCSCGKLWTGNFSSIKLQKTKSCGCIYLESNKTHGLNKTSEYRTWCSMKERCLNLNNKDYKYYGGRGIKICDRWLNSFENFYEDMGNKPSKKHSIDRINVNGNYCPENCRWVTAKKQMNNTSKNTYVTYKGKTQSLPEWCDELNLNYNAIRPRFYRGKLTIEQAFENPLRIIDRQIKNIIYKEVEKPIKQWCLELNLNYRAIWRRIFEHNWSVEKAFETPIKKK